MTHIVSYGDGDGGTRRGDRITEVFAWVTLDPSDDNEGILATMTALGPMPLIGADRRRVEEYRERAQQMAAYSPNAIELRRFALVEVLDTIEPGLET
jgi:hypothetical protein